MIHSRLGGSDVTSEAIAAALRNMKTNGDDNEERRRWRDPNPSKKVVKESLGRACTIPLLDSEESTSKSFSDWDMMQPPVADDDVVVIAEMPPRRVHTEEKLHPVIITILDSDDDDDGFQICSTQQDAEDTRVGSGLKYDAGMNQMLEKRNSGEMCPEYHFSTGLKETECMDADFFDSDYYSEWGSPNSPTAVNTQSVSHSPSPIPPLSLSTGVVHGTPQRRNLLKTCFENAKFSNGLNTLAKQRGKNSPCQNSNERKNTFCHSNCVDTNSSRKNLTKDVFSNLLAVDEGSQDIDNTTPVLSQPNSTSSRKFNIRLAKKAKDASLQEDQRPSTSGVNNWIATVQQDMIQARTLTFNK